MTTLKTISMYLRAAKTEAEDAGESTDGMANSVSELREELLRLTGGRVDIQIDESTFKSTYQIMKDLSVEWKNLSDISQANILEMVGGKRNSNVVAALLEDFSIAEQVVETSEKSSGSALKENEKYLDSIEGRLAKLKATFEAFSNSIISSDIVKFVVSSGDVILSTITSIASGLGDLGVILAGVGITKGIKSLLEIHKILPTMKIAVNQIQSIGASAYVGTNGLFDTDSLSKYVTSIDGLSTAQAKAAMSTAGLTSAQQKQVLNARGLSSATQSLTASQIVERMTTITGSEADAKAIAVKAGLITSQEIEENSTIELTREKILEAAANGKLSASEANVIASALGVAGANGTATGSYKLLTASIWENIKATAKWMVTNPVGWVMMAAAAIGIAVSAVDQFNKAQEDARKEAVKNTEVYKEQKKELEDLKQQYIDIMDSEQDEATKAKELDNIKQSLARTYGVEKEALDKLNQSRKEGLDLLEAEAQENAQDTINKNQEQYKKYSNEAFDIETGYRSWDWNAVKDTNIKDTLSGFGIKMWHDHAVYHTDDNDINFEYGNNAYEAYENLKKALSYYNDLETKYGELTDPEQKIFTTLESDFNKLENYLYNEESGIDKILSGTTDAYWTKYKYEFEKSYNTAFEEINTAEGLESWKEGFYQSLGDFASDPYFKIYTEGIFSDKANEIFESTKNVSSSAPFAIDLSEYKKDLDEVKEKLESIVSAASDVKSALKSAFSKDSFSIDEVLKLTELMPELAGKFKINEDGSFSIVYEDLKSASESYIKTQQKEIDKTNELIHAKITELETNIALNKSKMTSNSINSKSDYEKYINAIQADEAAISKLKSELDNNKIQSQYLANSTKDLSASFSEVIEILTNKSEVITEVEDAINNDGSISLDILNKIKDVYPELTNEVSNYLMGLVDEQSVLAKLRTAYDNDFIKYRDIIASKIKLTEEEFQTYLNALNTKYANDVSYYESLGALNQNFIDYMKDNYDLDLQNCASWCDAKEQMQAQSIAKIKALAAGINIEDYYDFETGKKIGDWSELYSQPGLVHSGVLEQIDSILFSHNSGMKEFGKLFKSASTLDGVGKLSSGDLGGDLNTAKESTNKLFDWIEVKLESLKRTTTSFVDKITKYAARSLKKTNLGLAIHSTRSEIEANQIAKSKYQQRAYAIGLDSKWVERIQNGQYHISDLDSEKDADLIKKIEEYQMWWDKIVACNKEIESLTLQEKDLIAQSQDLSIDDLVRKADDYARSGEVRQGKIDLKNAQGKSTSIDDYKSLIGYSQEENKALEVQKKYIESIIRGETVGSDRYNELVEQLEGVNDRINDNKISQAEWNKQIDEVPINKIEAQLSIYDKIKSYWEQFANTKSLLTGESSITTQDIKNQMHSSDEMSSQFKEYELYKQLREKAEKEGRDEDKAHYRELELEAKTAYLSMQESNEELRREARNLELYGGFEKDLKKINTIKIAIENLNSLVNDDALFNDNGSFSEQGISKIAILVASLEEAKKEYSIYTKELATLQANKDQYNPDEYAEKYAELTESINSSSDSIINFTNSIKDVYKNQAKAELDALHKLIDARSEALQKKKEYYDYDKTISSKSKEINAIKTHIAALDGVSTASAKAQKARLQEELANMEEELKETQNEHIYKLQIDGLEDQKEILTNIYDEFIKGLNASLDVQQQILNGATQLSNTSIDVVKNTLTDIAKFYGIDPALLSINNLAHFSTGGIVKKVKQGGDDSLVAVKNGETILTQRFTELLPYTTAVMDSFVKTINQSSLKNLKDISPSSSNLIQYDSLIKIEGNVDKNVIGDLKNLTKQVSGEICKDLIKMGFKVKK